MIYYLLQDSSASSQYFLIFSPFGEFSQLKSKQFKSFINYNVLRKLLVKSRKPAVIDVCSTINFEINSKVYTCIETDTIKSITEAFRGEQIITQYRIGKYIVDLYFPVYNIIV